MERITAIHEAGHALMAILLKQKVINLSIVPKDDVLGTVKLSSISGLIDDYISPVSRNKVEKRILVNFAGYIAECLATDRDMSLEEAGADKDFHGAVELASQVCGSNEETEAYLKWLLERGKVMFSVPYRKEQITMLADELLNRHTMSGRLARKIIMDDINNMMGKRCRK